MGSVTTLAPASPPLPPRAVTRRGGSPEPDVCQSHSVTCAQQRSSQGRAPDELPACCLPAPRSREVGGQPQRGGPSC